MARRAAVTRLVVRYRMSQVRHVQAGGTQLSALSYLRHEFFNEHLFLTLAETRATIETWRDDYNYRRPHSSLAL